MSRPLALAALFAATALLGACAAPYGGAPTVSADIRTEASPGLVAYRPDILRDVDSIRIHGTVCRRGPQTAPGAVAVRLEHLGVDGQVLDTASTPLPTSLNDRNRACGIYNVAADWTLAPGETVRVCAATSGRAACAPMA